VVDDYAAAIAVRPEVVDDYAAAIAVVMVLPYHPPIERGASADAGLDIAGDDPAV